MLLLLLRISTVLGHGQLTVPQKRECAKCAIDDMDSPINFNGDEEPESSRWPVNSPSSHPEGQSLVCRVANGNQENRKPLDVNAGGDDDVLTLKWSFTADHPGDGGLYVSYDADMADTQNMRFFKIANFPQMRQQNNKPVNVKLPKWLPPGKAVIRWDWYATHNWPWIEFYAHCIDVNIISTSTTDAASIPSYKIEHNTGNLGSYPLYDDTAADERESPNWYCGDCDWDKAKWLKIGLVGPKCVTGVVGNCCDMTNYDPTRRTGAGFPECVNVGDSGAAAWLDDGNTNDDDNDTTTGGPNGSNNDEDTTTTPTNKATTSGGTKNGNNTTKEPGSNDNNQNGNNTTKEPGSNDNNQNGNNTTKEPVRDSLTSGATSVRLAQSSWPILALGVGALCALLAW